MSDHPPSRPTGASSVETDRTRFEGTEHETGSDVVTVEEPLEIRLSAGGEEKTVAVTMRTPGADEELALGFLYCEGVLSEAREVYAVHRLEDPWAAENDPANVIQVELALDSLPELARLERHFFTTSACGICGKAGLENLRLSGLSPLEGGPRPDAELLCSLPGALSRAQPLFAATGGLHAAGLFDAEGTLLAAREDVGRHNALDKLVGWAFRGGLLPLADGIVMVSGRSSFELVQKSLAAGVRVLCSVSAPSSLAVELAREFSMTLVGFLRGESFNVYAGVERVRRGGLSTHS